MRSLCWGYGCQTAPVDGNYGLDLNTDAGFHGQGGPEGGYPCLRIPITGYYQPVQVSEGVPDGLQRDLDCNLSTETNSAMDLVVGLMNVGKNWRQGGFSEHACDLM